MQVLRSPAVLATAAIVTVTAAAGSVIGLTTHQHRSCPATAAFGWYAYAPIDRHATYVPFNAAGSGAYSSRLTITSTPRRYTDYLPTSALRCTSVTVRIAG